MKTNTAKKITATTTEPKKLSLVPAPQEAQKPSALLGSLVAELLADRAKHADAIASIDTELRNLRGLANDAIPADKAPSPKPAKKASPKLGDMKAGLLAQASTSWQPKCDMMRAAGYDNTAGTTSCFNGTKALKELTLEGKLRHNGEERAASKYKLA